MTHTFGAYFSPTGGTKRALEAVCGLLGGESEYLPLTGPDKKEKTFGPEELLVLALPVYAGQIPAVPGLLDGLKGDNTPCILLATYGNRHYDNALAQMKRLMEARGFRCVGAVAVITPHIFAPTLGVGRPDGEDLEVLARFAQGVKDKLASGAAGSVEVPGDPEPPAHPAVPVKKDRDWDTCLGCGFCAQVCPTGAINYEMKDEEVTETVGAIVAATGYDLMDWTVYGEYGAGQYPDVITSLQYERIMSASGPTGGHIKRPSDGKEPKSVVFIQCVGSRDKSIGRPYCSGFCCMYTAKQAVLTKDHIPDSQSYVFYMDIRSNAKLYDEFTRRAVEEYGTQYIRGRVSAIQPDGHGQYIVRGADTLLGKPVEVKADMVVLAVGIEGSKGANKLAETLHISYDGFGFFMESHCKLRPVETNTAGVFLAGVAQGPKDIPSSVAQGSGAAAKVIGLLSKPLLESDPQISVVDIKRCVGCGKCIKVCPFQAIVEKEIRGEKKAQTIEAVCQGCGLCTATCPQGAIQLSHFTDNQILAEVDALCRF